MSCAAMLPSSLGRGGLVEEKTHYPAIQTLEDAKQIAAAAAASLGRGGLPPLAVGNVGPLTSTAALIDTILAEDQRKRALLMTANPLSMLAAESAFQNNLLRNLAGTAQTVEEKLLLEAHSMAGLATSGSFSAPLIPQATAPHLFGNPYLSPLTSSTPGILGDASPLMDQQRSILSSRSSSSLLQPAPELDQLLLDALEKQGPKGRNGAFPQKLHQMLSDLEKEEGGSAIASFLPNGRAFTIWKPDEFVKTIMPKYFRMSRFSSFQRQLNLYEFVRVTDGKEKGSYFHELFIRGRPILASQIRRTKIKGNNGVITKTSRLPQLARAGKSSLGNNELLVPSSASSDVGALP